MHRRFNQAALGTVLLTLLACTGGGDSKAPTLVTGPASSPSATVAVFDPANAKIPLPNILATATAADPLTGAYISHTTGATVTGARPVNTSMLPPEALAYVNKYEMGSTNAVAGVNAPIYLQFTTAVDAATVTAANIKVFMLTPDSAGTENAALGFTDISATFRYSYLAGSTDLLLFPNFPLLPGTRYLYVVTNRVKDAAGLGISASPYFEALKSTTTLTGSFAALEPIRANATSGGNILLSGYAKVMDDLITATAATTITQRADIALMGRFITTGAGFVSKDASSAAAASASRMPVESALRAFAAGAPLGGLSGKTWANSLSSTANPTPDAYWSTALTALGVPVTSAPASVGTVTTGFINSAELSVDPVVARANAAVTQGDLTGITGAYNPAAGVLQPFRTAGVLSSYYHMPRPMAFVYITPSTAAPSGGYPLVIFSHGLGRQKEDIVAIAGILTASGKAILAMDQPLHGSLAVPTHTLGAQWTQDFMAVGAPLAQRSNIQQGAFNLHRLELSVRAGGFAGLGANMPSMTNIKFCGDSLGSIVGAYYLAGNTTLATSGLPYTQATLNNDMKGYLSVPGARLAYLIQNSPYYGPAVDAGLLTQLGLAKNSPSYHQFWQITQSVVDPIDPATMTTPLYAKSTGAPVDGPSRLSNRIAIQEVTSTTFSASLGSDGLPIATNGDTYIGNAYTRYFANALGGREVLGVNAAAAAAVNAIAPGFKQLAYTAGGTPAHAAGVVRDANGKGFLYTLVAGVLTEKIANAAVSASDPSPTEGFFQMDQAGITHSSFFDSTGSATATALIQKQMKYFLGANSIVVDPTQGAPALPVAPLYFPASQAPETFQIVAH